MPSRMPRTLQQLGTLALALLLVGTGAALAVAQKAWWPPEP